MATDGAPNPAPDPEQRSVGDRIGGTLLGIGAIGGVVCIVGVVLAWVFGVSLIMFKTGSMSPTIPTGSVAVVRQIPAAEIKVGDVVTVDRPGLLPVTHRVRSVAAGPGEKRMIVLRGDANNSDDPAPYTVASVRLVVFSVPGLAKVIVWFGNPFVLGGVTLGAALLVLWAFWPRAGGAPRDETPGSQQKGSAEQTPEKVLPGSAEEDELSDAALLDGRSPPDVGDLMPIRIWTTPPASQSLPARKG